MTHRTDRGEAAQALWDKAIARVFPSDLNATADAGAKGAPEFDRPPRGAAAIWDRAIAKTFGGLK